MDDDVLDGSGVQTPGISGVAHATLALVLILGLCFGLLLAVSYV